MLLERGIDPTAQSKYGDTLQTILETARMDERDLAAPEYQAMIADLAAHGVRVARHAS